MLLENLIFTGYQYSALRLGEGNFRLGLYGELATYGDLTFERKLPRDAGNFRIKPKSSAEPSLWLAKLHDYITGEHLVNPTLLAEAE